MMARRDMDLALEKMEQMTGIIGDYTMSLKVMLDTLHFQASYVGDQNGSYERFTKEVSEHMKGATVVSRAQREALEVMNERVT